jgi:uncharacterized protein DUF5946
VTVANRDAFHELTLYTLAHRDPAFIHQHVVDAFTAQTADTRTKPIALTFALVGLYLHVERGYTGKNVQRVHVLLARRQRKWPSFNLPAARGEITVDQVLAAHAGASRDALIDAWCNSVWAAYNEARDAIISLLRTELP